MWCFMPLLLPFTELFYSELLVNKQRGEGIFVYFSGRPGLWWDLWATSLHILDCPCPIRNEHVNMKPRLVSIKDLAGIEYDKFAV